jgi:hypothetical protein
MKSFVLTVFILLLGVSYALPFQAPVPGNYQCFSSEESPFDKNAQDIGANLSVNADSSYTFTTSNASENGSVQISEDTSADLTNFFQSGSSLVLQPSSGSASYEAMFVIDKQAGMYILLQNNNGLNIRCQSPGANIANAIKQIATEQAATEAPTTQLANTPEASGTPELSDSIAQDDDPYLVALSNVYATGKMAVLTKEWCDTRAPASQTAHAQAFETWQAEQFFFAIEEKMKLLLGRGFLTIEERSNALRDDLFAQLDASGSEPVSVCQNLLTMLNENVNLRQLFPNEYATIEAGSTEAKGGESLSAETTSIPNFGEVIAGGPLEPGYYQCISDYNYRPG